MNDIAQNRESDKSRALDTLYNDNNSVYNNAPEASQTNLSVAAQQAEEQKKSGGALRWLGSFLFMVVCVFVLSFLLKTFVLQPYEIPSGSMETTIMTNDKVFAEKVSYVFSQPQVGQVVTFADPQIASRTLIKRIVATAGQTINLSGGSVYIDGEKLDEPYTNGQATEPLNTASNVHLEYPYTVPEGYVFVMGDNRTNSQDSRYFGAVPVSSIEGHAFLIYFPFDHFSTL